MVRYLIAAVLSLVAVPAFATAPESPAREAILIDAQTGTILYEKNADQRTTTASMSKVMSSYMIFEALKTGRLTLDTKVPISERAWRMQGSKMFVELGNQIRAEDLIRGMLIQSGNDATVALAEAVGGTEDGFAAMATQRAHQMGMTHSNFANATGWPDPNHYSTVRDLATLAQRIMKDFPEYYHYFSEKEYTYHGIHQQNRDPLLAMNIGADGLKTGHTDENGYGLMASAVQNGRRLIMVINGLPSSEARAEEASRLMGWGFAGTDIYPLLKANAVIDTAAVWMGTAETVPLVLHEDLTMAMPREDREGLKVEVVLNEPVAAPIAEGQEVGKLRVTVAGTEPKDYPLYAQSAVTKLGFFGQMSTKVGHFFGGKDEAVTQ